MNKYVVGFLSLFDGELKQEIVEANSELEAGVSYLNWWDGEEPEPADLEDLYNAVYDNDCYIHILDLAKALKTNRGGTSLQNSVAQFDSESGFH